jgi:hypothetical protein
MPNFNRLKIILFKHSSEFQAGINYSTLRSHSAARPDRGKAGRAIA